MTTTAAPTIANIIFRQLGGSRFLAMTGAQSLVDRGNGLSMTLPASMTKGRVNRLTITLAGDDTYTVETARFRKLDLIVQERCEGIYVDMLHETIREMTGLATRL